MRYFIFILMCIICTMPVQAKHLHKEAEYQAYWCNKQGGQMEYVLNDKARVDCLLPDLAVEVDFAPKWAECIGQAIYYGKKTNRTPACLLILEKEKDVRYLKRLRYSVYKKKQITPFRTFTIKPDVFNAF